MFLALVLLAAEAALPATLEATVRPATPWLEKSQYALSLHCDILLTNPGATAWRLDDIEATATDADGKAISYRRLGANGTAPSIETVSRDLAPNGTLLVFNPFVVFDPAAPPARVRFRLVFHEPRDDSEKEAVAELTVTPRVFEQKAVLSVPLKGRVLVWDGHDYYSHHRRLNLAHPVIGKLGLTGNPGRYAYDFSIADEKGLMFRGKGEKREDWYGWETPVLAPGDGKVVEARSDVVDHQMGGPSPLSIEAILASPKVLYGNYVMIDHGNGEHSLIAHLRHDSLKVKAGDTVKRGQPVARMGFSGDAFTVHIHYELRSGAPFDVEGLPSRFRDFSRVLGGRTVPVSEGAIDSGDIVELR